MVYLRSPKHFNIGKQKIFSFNNKFVYSFNIHKRVYQKFILNNNTFNYLFFLKNKNFHLNFKIASSKISVQTSIKWNF